MAMDSQDSTTAMDNLLTTKVDVTLASFSWLHQLGRRRNECQCSARLWLQ